MPLSLVRLLYPELTRYAPAERNAALRAARDEPFDLLESLGVGFGLVVAVLLTGHDRDALTATGRLAAAVVNFAVALPLLAVLAGPFHVRRMRRGLRSRLGRTGP